MNWITINTEEEVKQITQSQDIALIYKHSPRCMTSLMAYRQLKSEVSAALDIDVPLYIVDVIKNRRESMAIAESFRVEHQSPQLLVVQNGKCLFNASHEAITLEDTLQFLQKPA
ncbi:bacillithiol system redox-active protein YtxJ [Dyadobacter sandarakinus]|uniref:Bacillithiol system redox-active protein YtxJ n=1 Tax=Dyadobacter sandarakinus TaxID=2747268 RepID=A0ABX7I4U9_9BACT|nr:bacillithiol system redox-active protein YtxJ [Dyadobacter sandarakinus]QRR01121.1 bacillithiol system redox-active protein YtxJ [Dyadobacter sandarakinus]